MMKKIIVLIVGILLVLPTVLAVKYVNRRHLAIQKTQSVWNYLRLAFTKAFRSLTMVGGYLCSTYPDESGACWEYTCNVYCPSILRGGCAVDIYDANYQFMREETTSPGTSVWIEHGARGETYWEIYYCNIECTCTKFQDVGCGAGPCRPEEMLRQRTCEQDCAEEQVCVYRDQCVACQDECTWGYLECRDNEKWACIHDCDDDPCNEWCYVSTCPTGTTCVERSNTELGCESGTTTTTTTVTTAPTTTTTIPQPDGTLTLTFIGIAVSIISLILLILFFTIK